MDINGKKVGEEKATGSLLRINVSRLNKGAYFVEVASAETVTVKKVMLQ